MTFQMVQDRRVGHGAVVARAAMLACMLLALPLAAPAAEQAALSVKEGGWRTFAGEQVVRTVMVDEETAKAGGPLYLKWGLTVGNAPVAGGTLPVPNDAGRAGVAIVLPMPQVTAVTGARLELELRRDREAVARRSYTLHIFPPRPAAPAALKDKELVLLDPSGRAAAALDYLGVQYKELSATWMAVTGSADMFLVGPNVPARELARFLAAVRAKVTDGAVCVVLEQSGLDARAFPYLALAAPGAGWNTAEGPLATDVVRGEMAPGALSDWCGRGRSVALPLRTPWRGNFTLMLDAARDGQAPRQSAVLEVPQGKGRYIFSQLLIGHDFLDEPAARYALANLLRYAATVPAHKPAGRTAVLADPDEKRFAEGFGALGLDADVNPASLAGFGVVLVYGSEASARSFRAHKGERVKALHRLIEAGGKVVLLDLRPDTVDAFSGLWDGELELAGPAGIEPSQFSALEDKPLLHGERPGEVESLCRAADYPAITYHARRSARPVSAAGLLAVAQGKGAVVFCQFPLPKDDKDKVALRVYSQLLTNMHMALASTDEGRAP